VERCFTCVMSTTCVLHHAVVRWVITSAVLLQGISGPEVLEVLAVREGTNLALDLSAQRIRVASDLFVSCESDEGAKSGQI
jgi:hypothetical protein